MEYLIKNVEIIEPGNSLHEKTRDLRIAQGVIQEISANLKPLKGENLFDFRGKKVSPGWVDIGAYGGEPGYEERETLEHLSKSAISGGYTTVCVMPVTKPVIHSKSEVHFILERSKNLAIEILPIGAVSKNLESKEMAEILLMKEAGAIAFSDGHIGIQKSGLLLRIQQYLNYVENGLLLQESYDQELYGSGQMHEGLSSIKMGLRGIPSMAEYSALKRDLDICQYTQAKVLFHKLSALESVKLLKAGKRTNSNIFTSVSIFNLCFTDRDLENFDSNLKLQPPLRSTQDRVNLVNGLEEGTIDCIVSDHQPWNPEKKDLEFQAAAFGSISLETAYSMFKTMIHPVLKDDIWVQSTSINPRRILSLPSSTIKKGNTADLTFFDPDQEWIVDLKNIKSLSKNTPLVGKKLKGKAIAIFKKGNLITVN